ncbi:MAG: sterol desaturase family protein [Melioribacteraceae bacterium]|nr:sterol desaturase family protein [Melioribacteraceae bacterium]MCF8430773.1 sterol desaturase family protein [Melioribacteraceae bacterium]
MIYLINTLIVIASFWFMELFAWTFHKYIMHGALWKIHKDHHKKEHNHVWEFNDLFIPVFSAPGLIALYFGLVEGFSSPLFWIGVGVSLYGICYFLAHDIFIHQRIKFLRSSNNRYLLAMRRAHKIHHKYVEKYPGDCFGFLWVPKRIMNEFKSS